MIYFDNAATGGFKPYSVLEQTANAIKYLAANPGRSGHRLSVAGANQVFRAREELNDLFNGGGAERVIFTKNCTEALNTAIFSLAKGHVITTVTEHNSVLRPLYHLQKTGAIKLSIVAPEKDGLLFAVKEALTPETSLVCVNAVSNVTGAENDVKNIGKAIKEYNKNIAFLVDGAQSAGHIPMDMQANNIDVLAVAGHKGLYGIMGSGALIFNNNIELSPLTYGGTGVDTFNTSQPEYYPEMLESGTLSLPAIISLSEGAAYVKKNVETFGLLLYDMSKALITELKNFERVKIYSNPNRSGIVAFSVDGIPSQELATVLSDRFDIAIRSGFHCAPLYHKFLGTDQEGLNRVSLAPQNTLREINVFVDALSKIICS